MSDPYPPEDDTRLPPPSARTGAWGGSAVPTRLGRFEIRKVLGEGAFGRVYLAFDPELGRQVAIKVPHRDGLTPAFRDRFLREARATATIHHPNVCPVYDVGTEGDLPYIVMHYVVGGTLAGLLNVEQPLSPRQAVAIARKLALGTAAAHAQGVIHRDLKLQNVLYDKASREVLITDFGLARLDSQSRVTVDGAVFGTPAYMSPEQARGLQEGVGPLSDVYSLGVILYHLLTGDVPFHGTVFEVLVQHWETPPLPPSAVRPGLSSELDAICLKAMAKAPADRFPSAKAFARALADHLREVGQSDPGLGGLAEETVAPLNTSATPPKSITPLPPPAPGRRPIPGPAQTNPVAAKKKSQPTRGPKTSPGPEPDVLPFGEPVSGKFGKAALVAGVLLVATAIGVGVVALGDKHPKENEQHSSSNPVAEQTEKEKSPLPLPAESPKPIILTAELPKPAPPKLPAPTIPNPPPKVEPPRASAAEIKALEREMYLPPIKSGGTEVVLADIPFSPDVMKDFAADVSLDAILRNKEKYKFRVAVWDALNVIRTEWTPGRGPAKLRTEVKGPVSAVKTKVNTEQEFWALGILQLELQLSKLDAVAGLRAAERKRWQANYDFALASVKARLVYMNEYDKVLGNLKTETLPTLNLKKNENGYTLIASETLKSSKESKKLAEEAQGLFEEITANYKGTPWSALAERDRKVPLGFAWKAAVLK